MNFKHGKGIFCTCKCTEDFCVSDVRNTCQLQGFFINGSGCDCIYFAGICQLNRFLHIFVSCPATHRIYLAKFKSAHIDIVKINKIHKLSIVHCFSRRLDHMKLHVASGDLHGIFHDLSVTDYNTECFFKYFRFTECFCYNFRTNTGRIADRYSYQWFHKI